MKQSYCTNKYFLSSIVLVSMLLFASLPMASKSYKARQKDGHEADFYATLPFKRSPKIDTLYRTIHNHIDLPIGYFKGLRDAPHQSFSWRSYGHRLFFHWGFNASPRSCKILQQLVNEQKWSKEVTQQFWDKVIAEQARRNRLTMQLVGKTLGFQLSGRERDYANAFASIITDVHILGDYCTTRTSTLQNLDLLVVDLKKALFESLRGGDEAKRINKLLDKTATITTESKRAEVILEILKRELPNFILEAQKGYFKRHFQRKGIALQR